MNKEFLKIIEKVTAIHQKKAEDYSSISNPYENFERSAELMSWFADPIDKAFINLIGTKLARLATLLSSKKEPNNESLEDSFVDLVTYCGLWGSFHAAQNKPDEPEFSPVCPYCMLGIPVTAITTSDPDGRLYHKSCFENMLKRKEEKKS